MNTTEIHKGGLPERQWREVEQAAKSWTDNRKELDAATGELLREAVWSRFNAGMRARRRSN